MEELKAVLGPDMSVQEIREQLDHYVAAQWKSGLEEHRGELTRVFGEMGDPTYGLYLERLLPPLFEALGEAGYSTRGDTKPQDYITGGALNFRNSLEQWGPEENRSRVFWLVVEDSRQQNIGTLLFDFYHSHRGFDVPAAPRFIAIAETGRAEILNAVRQIKESA